MVRFREILRLLHEQDLDFVIIGGVAAALHGSPVATLDVDVCIAFTETSIPKIVAAFRPLHPKLRHRPDLMALPEEMERLRGLKNLYLVTELGKIDLLGELPGVCTFDELKDKTVLMDVGGFTCRVLDLDTLIVAKTVAGRDKDRLSIRHLEAIRKMRREGPGLFGDGR